MTKIDRTETIQLTNPWSGDTSKQMTWAEIKQWCKDNIHESNRAAWLDNARRAYDNGDSETLGTMIIGS